MTEFWTTYQCWKLCPLLISISRQICKFIFCQQMAGRRFTWPGSRWPASSSRSSRWASITRGSASGSVRTCARRRRTRSGAWRKQQRRRRLRRRKRRSTDVTRTSLCRRRMSHPHWAHGQSCVNGATKRWVKISDHYFSILRYSKFLLWHWPLQKIA